MADGKRSPLGEYIKLKFLVMIDTGSVLVTVSSGDYCVCVHAHTFHLYN